MILEDVGVGCLEIELSGQWGQNMIGEGQRDMGEQTHPFVDLSLRLRLSSGSRIAHDETELCVEPVSDLVGLLDVIGHGKDEDGVG